LALALAGLSCAGTSGKGEIDPPGVADQLAAERHYRKSVRH
jgi:hypothetical protein